MLGRISVTNSPAHQSSSPHCCDVGMCVCGGRWGREGTERNVSKVTIKAERSTSMTPEDCWGREKCWTLVHGKFGYRAYWHWGGIKFSHLRNALAQNI